MLAGANAILARVKRPREETATISLVTQSLLKYGPGAARGVLAIRRWSAEIHVCGCSSTASV